MKSQIHITIINEPFARGGVAKYRATPEQIERNKREIKIQNERDARVRAEAERLNNQSGDVQS